MATIPIQDFRPEYINTEYIVDFDEIDDIKMQILEPLTKEMLETSVSATTTEGQAKVTTATGAGSGAGTAGMGAGPGGDVY